MGYNFPIVFKKLLIFALVLGVVPYNHADDRTQASGAAQSQEVTSHATSGATEKHDSSDLQRDASPRQSSNEPRSVRVILPPKDNYDHAAFWVSVALAIAGFLGIGVGVFTLLFIKRQAYEMRFQRILMRHSLNAMRRQSRLMESQTEILRDSVSAAQASADAANANIELITKERRSYVRIEIADLDLLNAGVLGDRVAFKVVFYGPTEIFILETAAEADLTDSQQSPDSLVWHTIGLPSIVPPRTEPIERAAYLYRKLSPVEERALVEGNKFMHFRGFVRYRDVFERDHRTRFNQVWVYSKLQPAFMPKFGCWVKCGEPDDNCET